MFCGFDLDDYILWIRHRYMALRLVIVTSPLANYHIIASKSPLTTHGDSSESRHQPIPSDDDRAAGSNRVWQRTIFTVFILRNQTRKEELWRYTIPWLDGSHYVNSFVHLISLRTTMTIKKVDFPHDFAVWLLT
jgi:hypothetical protein